METSHGYIRRRIETVYNDMSEHLDRLGLRPTAIIIDDKWQKAYGTFLPDPEK